MSDETTNLLRDQIKAAIDENDVILFMKGTPDQPMCGFSARTVAMLQSVGRPFAAVNILPDPRIRQELSAVSNWPTIPQLFVDGEFIGGGDSAPASALVRPSAAAPALIGGGGPLMLAATGPWAPGGMRRRKPTVRTEPR